MNLTLPTVSVTLGPLWAQQTVAALSGVDSHNHINGPGAVIGRGQQIPTAGLNINADLPFNQNNLTEPRSLRMFSNGSALTLPSDVACLNAVSSNMYWNAGDGYAIQLTSAHDFNPGMTGNITSLTAPGAAIFSFGVAGPGTGQGSFSFLQDTGWYSALKTGALVIYDSTEANQLNGVTIKSPPSLGTFHYTLTLPSALPASQLPLLVNHTGTLSTGLVTGQMLSAGSLPGSQLPVLMSNAGALSTGVVTLAMLALNATSLPIPAVSVAVGGVLTVGWLAANGLSYWIDPVGMAHVQGFATNFSSVSNLPMALPGSYAPQYQQNFQVVDQNGNIIQCLVYGLTGYCIIAIEAVSTIGNTYAMDSLCWWVG
jgi:hypothetical protein